MWTRLKLANVSLSIQVLPRTDIGQLGYVGWEHFNISPQNCRQRRNWCRTKYRVKAWIRTLEWWRLWFVAVKRSNIVSVNSQHPAARLTNVWHMTDICNIFSSRIRQRIGPTSVACVDSHLYTQHDYDWKTSEWSVCLHYTTLHYIIIFKVAEVKKC